VPVEGVVNALRRINAALIPGGLLVDTQPVSAEPSVEADGVRLGVLDMREWSGTIDAVDRRVEQTIADRLFAHVAERSCVVIDEFDSGTAFLDAVAGWRGTRLDG
jgi:hypothetical protein